MKQRIEAVNRMPSMKMVVPKKKKKTTFDDDPWPLLIKIVAMYKSELSPNVLCWKLTILNELEVPEEELRLNLEHLRMLLYDVELPDYPKKELLCLLVAVGSSK